MRLKIVSVVIIGLMLASTVPLSDAKQNGIYSSGTGCSCHYGGSATVSMTGQPTSYTAGQSYTLSISVSGGVSGSAGGFSLDVDKGTLSTGGVGIMAVKVNGAGKSATHTTSSYRSWSVDWTAPSTGSGAVQFDLSGLTANGNGANTGDAHGTATYTVPEAGGPAPNNPPAASNLQLSPTNPVTSDTLTLTYTYYDSDGDSESGTTIRWYKDGMLISSQNDQSTVPSSLTTKGESWNVTVTPSDGTDDGAPVHSSSLQVVNSIPVVDSAGITPSDAVETDDLTVTWSSSDADGDSRTVSGIEWYVDDSKVSAFDDDVTIPAVAIRDGDVWYAKVKVNDGETDSAWFTTQNISIGSDNTPPTMVSVTLGGPYTTTDDIQATAQGNDADNDALTYEWDWPGTMGASSSTLPSWYTEKGESWTVRCRVTDGVVYSDWMESSAVVIQNTAPVLSSVAIDQDTIFFENETTYSFEATDADGDQLTTSEAWSLDGDTLTLTLSVYDDDMSYSNTLSDTVQIINSPPTLSYDGQTTQSALIQLNPTLQSYDANGDTVTATWEWMRNGFLTDENGSMISENKLGAGDIWTAMITPNDGQDDGPVLIIDFTISNTAPTASISAPDSLIQGAMVTFSAMGSSDVDGAIVNAIWSIEGTVMHNGMTFTTTMTQQLNLQVKVIDDLGADDVYAQIFTGSAPPVAMNTEAKLDGSDVVLTWEGTAEEWAIVHNGEVIDSTSAHKYRHSPTMEGQHTYAVLPIIEGQTIHGESVSSTDSVEMSSNLASETPGPSDTAGLIFSIILLLIGLTGVAFSFIPRRD